MKTPNTPTGKPVTSGQLVPLFLGCMVSESSAPRIAPTSNTVALVLRRLATVKNDTVAASIGHDAGHVSRIASNERGIRLNELEAFLSTLGLRVIECDGQVVSLPAEELSSLRYLARKALS